MSGFKKFSAAAASVLVVAVLLFCSSMRVQAAGLTPLEAEGILYMREEEKLARDVYITLSKQWNLQVFQNISQSEQNHMNAMKTLIDHYGLKDPALGAFGAFTNPNLQALYNALVLRGKLSLAEALKVGGAIEEIDILDLRKYFSQSTKSDILQVYNHLLNGSYNHLRAFVSNLSATSGETYQPQYLSAEDYQAIIDQRRCKGRM
jgi:hypothetical protein